jgi:hypothetical protein
MMALTATVNALGALFDVALAVFKFNFYSDEAIAAATPHAIAEALCGAVTVAALIFAQRNARVAGISRHLGLLLLYASIALQLTRVFARRDGATLAKGWPAVLWGASCVGATSLLTYLELRFVQLLPCAVGMFGLYYAALVYHSMTWTFWDDLTMTILHYFIILVAAYFADVSRRMAFLQFLLAQREQQTSKNLVDALLPSSVVRRLMANSSSIAEEYPYVAVLFAGIKL